MTDTITMPRLSDSMEEGTILKWLIAPGEPVEAGADLVEIETDKATMTHQADAAGVLEILTAEGETVAVGDPIARVGDGAAATPEPQPTADNSTPPASESPRVEPTPPADDSTRGGGEGRAVATPLARRVAAQHGVALAGVAGSGPRGRVVKGDVLAAAGVAAAPTPTAAPDDGARVQPLTRLQRVIAERMVAAGAVPVFQVQTDVAIDAALELRARIKDAAGEGPAPSVNDLIVKAAALALRDHPLVNASYRDEGFEHHDAIHVGVAVAADDALVVPTVTDADRKSLGAIAADVRRLAERVRAGTVAPAELSGATFTVSNLGMYGMTAITPVINPPQAAILGVGAARDTLARDELGEIVDRRLLALTLTCDHRILYGAHGAAYLADVKALLEAPLRLVC